MGQPGWTVSLLGSLCGDRLVGFAETLLADDTPSVGWVFVTVDPDHQGKGVGTHLLGAALARLDSTVVLEVVSRAYRAGAAQIEALGRRFVAPHGFDIASTETVLEIDLAAERPGPSPAPPDYALATFVDGVPIWMRPAVGMLMGRVDAEAPHGNLAWEPAAVTPEAYATDLARRQEDGIGTIETVAVSGDEIVAWTCVLVPPNVERAAEIEGTIVLPAHRGRGLGLAVKTANLQRLMIAHGGRRVRTSSDDANRWMRSINRTLGFQPVEVEAIFRRTTTPAGR